MSEAALIPIESWPLIFDFWLFIPFFVGSWSKAGSGTGSGSETVMHSGNGSAKAKSYGYCGSGSTTEVISLQASNKKTWDELKHQRSPYISLLTYWYILRRAMMQAAYRGDSSTAAGADQPAAGGGDQSAAVGELAAAVDQTAAKDGREHCWDLCSPPAWGGSGGRSRSCWWPPLARHRWRYC